MGDLLKYRGRMIPLDSIINFTYEEQCEVLKLRGNAIQFIDNPTEEQQLLAVTQNGYAIKYIPNPAYKVQEMAFSHQATAVQFVANPATDLLEAAFLKDPNVLQFIKNPTYEQKLSAIRRKGGTIQYITDPSAELIDMAITQNPISISYLTKPDNNLILFAIRRNPRSVKVIINKIPRDLQIEALKCKGQLIKYIKNPDTELIEIALQSDPQAIQYIQNPSIEAQMAAVGKSSSLVKYVDTSIPAVQVAIVEKKRDNIFDLKNPSSYAIDAYESAVFAKDKTAKKEFAKTNVYPSDHFYIKRKYLDYIARELQVHHYCEFLNQFDEPLSDIIDVLNRLLDIKQVRIASGYLYKSGLNIMNIIINPIIKSGGTVELVIGALQNYIKCVSSHQKMMGMDFDTAQYLRGLLNFKHITLKTYTDNFYHGKFYKLIGNEYTVIIIGSSNVSLSGLRNNIELNSVYIYPHNDARINKYDDWYNKFIGFCDPITELSLSVFNKTITETDIPHSSFGIGIDVDIKRFKERVRVLTNNDVQNRMEIWLDFNPSHIYEQIKITPFIDYILFEYPDKHMYVFESFTHGNAFYCFKSNNLDDLLIQIQGKSKLQLFKISEFYKRGYHISDAFNLKINVASMF